MATGTETRRWDAIDWGLVVAIIGLSVFLIREVSGPAIDGWRNRVRPGVQVCQQFVEKTNGETDPLALSIKYLLYLPTEYDAGRKWPLVVFLHGAGERGHDLELVRRRGVPQRIEQGEKPGFLVVSPQCGLASAWEPESLVALIEEICRVYAVDRDRVYLTGFSMGGFGTWQTACYDPDRFAAIVPLAAGGDVEQAPRLVNVPVWAFHGEKDDVVPLAANEAMVTAVKQCGGESQLTVYPGQGHGICEETYANARVWEWLLAQRRR